MILVERHNYPGNPELIKLCTLSKELYNRCNYLMRKAWFSNHFPLPDINTLVQYAKPLDCYKNFNHTKIATQTIRKVLTDWSNYKKAKKAYEKDPTNFTGKPKPPGYKKKLAQIIFFNETIKKKPLKDGIITPTNNCFSIPSNRVFLQVVVTPKRFGFMIDVQYNSDDQENKLCKQTKLDMDKICTIDIGLNNLCAITLDQNRPILINGRIIKSINQWYNKNPSQKRSKKRYFRIENYFHHTSKFIINECLKYRIGTIVVGKNDGWKQNINLGKKTNQNFYYVPFYLLMEKIKYKAKLVGINVVFTEEAYTSQASFYDNDPVPEYNPEVEAPVFSGKRKYRGLYITKDGFAVNSDINGSMNIGRKVFPLGNHDVIPEFYGIRNRSLVARPVVVNPLQLTGEELVD